MEPGNDGETKSGISELPRGPHFQVNHVCEPGGVTGGSSASNFVLNPENWVGSSTVFFGGGYVGMSQNEPRKNPWLVGFYRG